MQSRFEPLGKIFGNNNRRINVIGEGKIVNFPTNLPLFDPCDPTCPEGVCEQGMYCDPITRECLCKMLIPLGDPCNHEKCLSGFHCINNFAHTDNACSVDDRCVRVGTCAANVGVWGDCDPSCPNTCQLGLYCNNATFKCEPTS